MASPQERIDFLKHSIAFTESTIRAYDTKSQIALAAFVLSMNPLWSIMNATCTYVALQPIVGYFARRVHLHDFELLLCALAHPPAAERTSKGSFPHS